MLLLLLLSIIELSERRSIHDIIMINEQLLLKDDEEKCRKENKVTMVLLRLLGVTKICLQPKISTAIHDKDDIRGLLIFLVFQELSQMIDSSISS